MPETILNHAEEKMEHTIEAMHREFTQIRSGRANPKMLERVVVDYYGVDTPINQVASVSVPEGNQIYVKPYDRSLLVKIEKAIQAANFGINPSNDGVGIRLILPVMTEERRRDNAKTVHKIAEEAKVAIRNVRREAIDKLKKLEKDKAISEDELEIYLEEAQNITDKYTKKIDDLASEKEKEIMHI